MVVKRGEIYYAELDKGMESELGGTIPVLIVSNNIDNRFSPTVSALPITTSIQRSK